MSNTNVKGFDLYNLINGEWEKTFTIPSHESEWGTFKEMTDTVKKNIKTLLSDNSIVDTTTKIGNEIDIIRRFNSVFNNTTQNEDKREAMALVTILSLLNPDNFTDRSNIGYIIGLLEIYTINPLFSAFTSEDPRDTDNVRLNLSFPGLTLPDRIYYIDNSYADYVEEFKVYADNIIKIYSDLIKDTKLNFSKNIGQDVTDTETLIAKSLKTIDQRRELDSLYSRMPVMNFIDSIIVCDIETDKKSYDCSTARNLWKKYFSTAYIESINYLPDQNINFKPNIPEELIVYDIAYFQKLTRILMSIPISKLMSYLSYTIITSICTMTIRSFDDAYHKFVGVKLGGQSAETPRQDMVFNMIDDLLGEALGRVYVDRYFDPKSKEMVKEIVERIKVQMRRSIESNTWMGKDTKKSALLKLDNMGVKIGYPDKEIDRSQMLQGIKERLDRYEKGDPDSTLTDLIIYINISHFSKDILERIDTPRDPTLWAMNPHDVNAYYSPHMNEIAFPAGILISPIFDPKNSMACNYGGIGTVIAHEITHGFDDQGRKYDYKGNIKNWWTPQDLESFKASTNRMIDQYSAYKVVIPPDTTDAAEPNIMKVNGKLTLGENIADLGGVTLSFKALTNGVDLSLEEKKKFFESYALLWRKKQTSNKTMSKIISDPHSPHKYRVWIVRNMDEFYDVYGITPESPMYLKSEERIRIF